MLLKAAPAGVAAVGHTAEVAAEERKQLAARIGAALVEAGIGALLHTAEAVEAARMVRIVAFVAAGLATRERPEDRRIPAEVVAMTRAAAVRVQPAQGLPVPVRRKKDNQFSREERRVRIADISS